MSEGAPTPAYEDTRVARDTQKSLQTSVVNFSLRMHTTELAPAISDQLHCTDPSGSLLPWPGTTTNIYYILWFPNLLSTICMMYFRNLSIPVCQKTSSSP